MDHNKNRVNAVVQPDAFFEKVVQVNRVAQWNPFRRGGAAVRCGLLGIQRAGSV